MAISGIGSSYNQTGIATNYVQEKITAKEAGRKMAEQPVRLSISNEGKEYYRNSIQQGGQESYDIILQRWPRLRRNMRRSIPMQAHYHSYPQALRFHKEAGS